VGRRTGDTRTPTVGLAYLKAYSAIGDRMYLDAARDAAGAVVYGQLRSGGWTNAVDFDPQGSKVALYRNGKGRGRDTSSLDDGITQSAIRFLARADQALEFKDAAIHEAAGLALDALLKAQFPIGAFPQGWTAPVPPHPVLRASYPAYDWRTEGRVDNYWDMYTLNDGLAGSAASALLDALDVYRDDRCRRALVRLGDFLILAQMPDPQPAWAQQYSYEMHPIWARRFEPAAVTGGESQDAMETLMKVYRLTGDRKYLEPIPRALEYLKRSRLSDGRLARYYELKTNRPLYMTRSGRDYSLTYDDSNLPDHYGWKVASRLEAIEKEYAGLLSGQPAPRAPSAADQESQVRQIIRDLDDQGRWVSTYGGERLVGQPKFKPGMRYIASEVFSRNVGTLSDYLSATRPP
jgi:PelA/Pel-15E family pectate lyase